MLGPLLMVIAAQFAPDAPAPGTRFDGQCLYPPVLGDPEPAEVRVLCNTATVEGDSIVFGQRSWGPMLRFTGTFEDALMEVDTVVPRTGDPVEVRGQCRVFYAGGEVSVISCTAVRGARSWVANFIPSRL